MALWNVQKNMFFCTFYEYNLCPGFINYIITFHIVLVSHKNYFLWLTKTIWNVLIQSTLVKSPQSEVISYIHLNHLNHLTLRWFRWGKWINISLSLSHIYICERVWGPLPSSLLLLLPAAGGGVNRHLCRQDR